MERIEEFVLEGKSFMYIDLSNLTANDEFLNQIALIEPLIAKYPENSLYTVTNIDNVRFDTKSKDIVAQFMAHNKPYVNYGAIFGLDGIKKVMVTVIMKMSGRTNFHFAFSKEKAIEWLLQHD